MTKSRNIAPPDQQLKDNLGGIVMLSQFNVRLADFIAAEHERAAQHLLEQFGVNDRYAVRVYLHEPQGNKHREGV